MAVNKVIFGGETVIDLTADTLLSSDQLVTGATAHGADGASLTGTNPYVKAETDELVADQTDLIAQIKSALEGKAAGGGSTAAEVCEVSIADTKMEIFETVAYYMTVDENGAVVNGSKTFMGTTVNVSVLKNSIMFVDIGATASSPTISGGITRLNNNKQYYAFHVSDDGTFDTGSF